MVAQNLLQGIVEQVGCCVVGRRCLTGVYINASHKVGLRVLWKLLNDVDRLTILALCVGDGYGFVLAYEHAVVAYLSAHLAIEWGVVQHKLVVGVLLLCYLAVAQDVTLVLGEVVAYKLLLALAQYYPVGVFYGSGVACTFLLLLHLGVELVGSYAKSVLTADKLGEVQRESVCVEQAECLNSVELCLALLLKLFHSRREEVDALLQGAEERVFLLLYYVEYKVVLCLKLWEGISHLACQYGDELVDEGFLLSEECIGIANGTAKDSANYVACLCVGWQLAVGDRESYGTQVVGAYTHSHVGLFAHAILHACYGLFFLDNWLEDVGIVVGVLILHGTY